MSRSVIERLAGGRARSSPSSAEVEELRREALDDPATADLLREWQRPAAGKDL